MKLLFILDVIFFSLTSIDHLWNNLVRDVDKILNLKEHFYLYLVKK